MNINSFSSLLSALLLGALVFTNTGCKETGCTDPDAFTFNPSAVESDAGDCEYPVLSLVVDAKVGTEAFALNQVYQINDVATTFTTAQYYLSEIAIEDEEGGMEATGVTLLVKPSQSTYEIGEIKAGHKHMLSFGVGVDSTKNFLDPTTYAAGDALAPQSPSMHWSWNSGYIFLRLEGQVDTDSDGTPDTNFELHVGGMNQYTPLTLDTHVDADAADTRITLAADWAKIFDGIDLTTDNVTHTMDNMPLAMALVRNLSKVFSVE